MCFMPLKLYGGGEERRRGEGEGGRKGRGEGYNDRQKRWERS